MKILAINGSHRGEAGYTQFLLDKVLEGARSAGADCESVALAKLKMIPCRGCLACQRQANQEVIPVPFFRYLKRLKFFKPVMAREARKAMGTDR